MYAQPDHRFCRRWAVMTDPEETLGASGAGIKVGGFVDFVAFPHSVFSDKAHSQVLTCFETLSLFRATLKWILQC